MIRKEVLGITILAAVFFIQLSMIFIPIEMINTYFELFRPLAWLIMLIFVIVLFEKDERPYKQGKNLLDVSILGIAIYLFVMVISGIFLSFSYNPLDFTLKGMIVRFWSYLLIVIIREILRSKIMTSVTGRNKWVMFILVTIVFTFTDVNNLKSIMHFDLARNFDFFVTSILPLLALNFFLTYSASKGGLKSNLLFVTVFYSVPLFSPVLPGISKILDATITSTIVFIMYIVSAKLEWNNRKKENVRIPNFHWKWLFFPGGVFVVTILLGLGTFPFIPISIASDSMKQEIQKGDLVIVHKIKQEDISKIKEGDIIHYYVGNISVIHRIIEIDKDYNGRNVYITKGDNNEAIDIYVVKEEQIIGTAKFKIPLLGWVALVFKPNVSLAI